MDFLLGLVVAAVFLTVAPILIAMYLERESDVELLRLPLFWRSLGLFVVSLLAGFILGVSGMDEIMSDILLAVIAFPLSIFGYRWVLQRIRNIGWSKNMVWIALIPIANIVFSLFLLFKPGQNQDQILPGNNDVISGTS